MTIKRKPVQLTAPIEVPASSLSAQNQADTQRSFRIAAYTGAIIDTWYGKLVFDVSGMSAKSSIPVLREHQRDRVVGYGTGAPDGKIFSVTGHFSAVTPDAKECLALADEGYPWQASVGIRPVRIKTLAEKESAVVNGKTLNGPAEIWLKSVVGEVSFVSLGADSDTSIRVLAEPEEEEIEVEMDSSTPTIKTKEHQAMTKEEWMAQAPEMAAELKAEGIAEGTKTERERVMQILSADPEMRHAAVVKEAIMAGTSSDGVFRELFHAERKFLQQSLSSMAQQATPPVGHSHEEQQQQQGASGAEVGFMDKARALAKENKLTLAQAVRLAQAEYPELHEAFLKKQASK